MRGEMSDVLKWHPQGTYDIHGSYRVITDEQEVACCKCSLAAFMCSQATGEGTDGVVPSQAWLPGFDAYWGRVSVFKVLDVWTLKGIRRSQFRSL